MKLLPALCPLLLALGLVACSDRGETGDASPPPGATASATMAATATETTPGTSPSPPAPTATATTAVPSGPAEHEGERTLAHLRELSQVIGARVSGTEGEDRAVDYIAGQFRAAGYAVEVQEFTFDDRGFIPETLLVGSEEVPARRMTGSGDGTIRGRAVYVGLADEAGLRGKNVDGLIALADRGTLTFEQKLANVRAAGAKGLIVINSERGLFSGRVEDGSGTVVLGVGSEDGPLLKRAAEQGTTLTLEVPASEAKNVIARSAPGAACDLVVGGHHDTVPDVPGASDNASGTAAVIELARSFAVDGIDPGLCFVTFGAEESGLFGSEAFVRQETAANRTPRSMVNLDVLGTGSVTELIGDGGLTAQAAEIARRMNVNARQSVDPQGTSSDHASFLRAGIPAIFIASNDFSRIHTPQDTVAIISLEMLEEQGDLAYALIASTLKQVARR